MNDRKYTVDFWGAMVCSILSSGWTSIVFAGIALFAAILNTKLSFKKVNDENS